jgi:hypothetical protein
MEGKFKHQQTKVVFRQAWIIKFQECPILQLWQVHIWAAKKIAVVN